MTIWSSILAALEALRANTLRTALTMLGVIIGVAAVIATVSIATGAHARVTEQIQSLGSNLLLVLSGSFNAGGIRLGMGTLHTITEDDARAIQREVARIHNIPFTVVGILTAKGQNACGQERRHLADHVHAASPLLRLAEHLERQTLTGAEGIAPRDALGGHP